MADTLDDSDVAALPRPSEPPIDRERDLLRAQLFGGSPAVTKIGRYLVLGELGVGGMGHVYSAYDPKLDRKVAIKVLHRHYARQPSHKQRLLREAQALARLSSPHVVTIFEVSEFEDTVFLAMELVAGQTLQQWQESEARPWREIVERYLAAGRGLCAAHDAGLIHRDFKPANVLVGDDSRVRVVDFGLAFADELSGQPAKLTAEERVQLASEELSPSALEQRLTRTGSRLGTVAYMAPEQLAGDAVGPAGDQFAFCVALYEALSGARPYLGNSAMQLLTRIGSGELQTPNLGRGPRWLHRLLLRGLAYDPKSRHPSMGALLDAIGRRLARRRRFGAVIVAGGLVTAGLLARPAAAEPCANTHSEFAEVWNEEQREDIRSTFGAAGLSFAERAAQTTVTSLDRYAERWTAARVDACEATHVRHLQSPAALDLRVGCLDDRRREFVALTQALGRIDPAGVRHADDAVAALGDVARCDDIDRLAQGVAPIDPSHADDATAIREELAHARAVFRLGDAAHAQRLVEPLAKRARALEYPPLLAEALLLLGTLSAHRAEFETAQAQLLESVDIAEGHRHDEVAADAWQALGSLATQRMGDPERGDRWLRRARAANARIGASALRRAALLEQQGHLHLMRQRFDDAERAYNDAWDLRLQHLGGSHVYTIAAQAGLANTQAERGDLDKARATYAALVTKLEAQQGAQHPRVAEQRFNLARVEIADGQLDAAAANLEHVRSIYEQAYGRHSARLVDVLLALAQVDEHRGNTESALQLAERARDLLATDADPSRVSILNLIGTLHYRDRRWDAALVAFSRAHELTEAAPEPQKLDLAIGHSNIGDALMGLDRTAEARERYDQALALMTAVLPPEHELVAYPLQGIGGALLAQGHTAAAVQPLQRALAIRAEHPGDQAGLAAVHWSLARALVGEQPKVARAHATTAHTIFVALSDTTSAAEVAQWLTEKDQ